ncbi:MAG TPA: DUF169 domain-containing protein [Thermoplasmata archaeon]|jgi:uncharacterized protein (DUF169 family)|nr:DUF169 domain-containing protein [Thermoplasmata archaeon]
MTDHLRQIATDLSSDLELDQTPVQVTYLDAPPKGVTEHPGGVPSVCTFFAEGQKHAFYAALPAHEACEIGAFVLGAAPEGELGARLMATVGMMQKEGYLQPGEEGKIPRNATAPKYVAYGPLGSLPMAPTSVLFFARPKSAMLAMEAANGPVPMNGRPMCAIVPTLNQGASVAVSMGCVGSRVFTQMADDRMLVGVRGDHLDQFHASVKKIVRANQLVGAEDLRRRNESAHPFVK